MICDIIYNHTCVYIHKHIFVYIHMYIHTYTYKYLSPNNLDDLGTNINAEDFSSLLQDNDNQTDFFVA